MRVITPVAALLLGAGLLLGTSAAKADRQDFEAPPAPVPFGVGERANYDVKFSFVKAGSATMEVVGIETVRERKAYHTRFILRGGIPGYRVNDRFESWMDVETLDSLRFISEQKEGGREREKHYEIFPERAVYLEKGDNKELPSISEPLDEGSFFYFVRTMLLEVGNTYSFDRYFRPDRNPVTIEVLRREKVKVPAGEYDALVVRPIIKTKGIFSKNGRAEVWLSDDDRHIVLQMTSRLRFGSINFYLRSFHPAS
jgi:hypothetical protein